MIHTLYLCKIGGTFATTSSLSILKRMRRVVMFLFLSGFSCLILAQSLQPEDALQVGLVIAKLPPPSYPPMALAAHVWGNVELKLSLRRDGTVDSVEAVSGPPMLRQPALVSAKQTQFECGHCNEPLTTFRIVYKFELGETRYCSERDSSYPRVIQSPDTITITDQPVGTCDPAATTEEIRVRSARCMFLWKCRRVALN
jgi:hypothetical protein